MGRFSEVCCSVVLSISISFYSSAQSFPDGFSRQLVSGSITKPTAMAFAPDGRIFVTQQTGQLRIIKNDMLLSTPFLTLTVDGAGERGLIGIAIDPDFDINHFVYLYYTVPGTPPHNRLSRFTAQGDVVVAGSELVLLDLDPLSSNVIHNGGSLVFGQDGKLYIGVGDNAKPANAQNLTTYHGKILRINKDGGIPDDNPFIAASGHAKRIWALGVRNPFSLAVNTLDGKIFVNDVGANSFEEINDITTSGQNFGWPDDEGVSENPDYADPVYTYPHGSGDALGCAITGGTFFTPTISNYPSAYFGTYFFQDFCEGWVNVINPEEEAPAPSLFAQDIASSSLYLTTGTDGNLYFLSRDASVYRIVYSGTSPPFITQQPVNAEVLEGASVSFMVGTIGSTPLTYQWKKDGADIVGATEAIFLISEVDESDGGTYSVAVTNVAGNVNSDEAVLTVIPVVGVLDERQRQIVVYPNAVSNGVAVLQIHTTVYEHASISIIDPLSSTSRKMGAALVPGLNSVDLPVAGLPKGTRIVAVDVSGRKSFFKLLILP